MSWHRDSNQSQAVRVRAHTGVVAAPSHVPPSCWPSVASSARAQCVPRCRQHRVRQSSFSLTSMVSPRREKWAFPQDVARIVEGLLKYGCVSRKASTSSWCPTKPGSEALLLVGPSCRRPCWSTPQPPPCWHRSCPRPGPSPWHLSLLQVVVGLRLFMLGSGTALAEWSFSLLLRPRVVTL